MSKRALQSVKHTCQKCNSVQPEGYQFITSRNLCRNCNMVRHTQEVKRKRMEYLQSIPPREKKIRERMAFLERHTFFKRTGSLADYSPSEKKYQQEWMGYVDQLRDALPARRTNELKKNVLKSKLMDELEQ